MALVVLLRAVNVGGHNTFRPSQLAKELAELDVVNIGAAGTLVVRKKIARARLLETLRARLPVKAEIIVCEGRELVALADADPFAGESAPKDETRFVTFLSKARRDLKTLPKQLPLDGPWALKIVATQPRFVIGVYKRHQNAAAYMTQIEKRLGIPVTLRSWNTVAAIVKTLRD